MRHIVLSSLLAVLSHSSSCGDSMVPFSVEIGLDGQLTLGCARPTCFGWAPTGLPASYWGSFYMIYGHHDGFIRAGLNSIPAYGPEDARFYRPQTAMCEPLFTSPSCSSPKQWVGGIAPLLNQASYALLLQCCTYDGLLQSEDSGVASLQPGQIIKGGEVFSAGRQFGFDYIANIMKVVLDDGSVRYDVSTRRMACAGLSDAAESAKTQSIEQYPTPAFHTSHSVPQYQPVPAPPRYAAPVARSCGGAGCLCFAGDMNVWTIDGTFKRMDELKKGDWVLSVNEGSLEFVPIKYWLHRVPTQEAVFNVFETEDGKTIKLTDKHYIFKGDCSRLGSGPISVDSLPREAVTADQIRAGDCLFTVGAGKRLHEIRVVRASKTIQTGIYAPMTTTGRIVVNGMHASCHNVLQANSIGLSLYKLVDMMNEIYDIIFGSASEEIVQTPTGLSTILEISEVILPNNLVTL